MILYLIFTIMFSESFDATKNDIFPEIDKEKGNEKLDDIDVENPGEKSESQKILNLKDYIDSKTTEYRSFFRNFPNDFHKDLNGLSITQGVQEVKESINGIPEQKIKGFDEKLDDGKNVEVREENGEIHLKFLNKTESTTIVLSNFDKVGKGSKTDTPKISISGDTENLPKNIKNIASKINGTIELSKDNTEQFKEIFDCIHKSIIRPKIEEFHGYADNVKQKTENLFLEISMKNVGENGIDTENIRDNVPSRRNKFIEHLMENSIKENSEFIMDDYCDLMARRIALSLCLLLRNSSKNEIKNSINNALGYRDGTGVDQKNATNKSEESIEFIPVDEFFVVNSDALINLAVDYCKKDQSLDKSEQIIQFLTF